MRKIDKKACRAYLDPGIALDTNCGLLHASAVRYIVCTAVKNIGHRRLLVLYLYAREQAASGLNQPSYTIFQATDDFVSYAHTEGAKTGWRTAQFENLERNYYFLSGCAFYTRADELRVTRFCDAVTRKESSDGFTALCRLQRSLRQTQLHRRRKTQAQNIIQRMKPLRPVGKRIFQWVLHDLLPQYLFYDYQRGKKNVIAHCTACGRKVLVSGVKYDLKTVCPSCRHPVVCKSRGKRGRIWDRVSAQFIQKVSAQEIVIRILKCDCFFHGDTPKAMLRESARIFMRLDGSGEMMPEFFYNTYRSDCATPWHEGVRPRFSFYQDTFEADTAAFLYTGRLAQELAGTPWQYCPITAFYTHFREPMEALPFFAAHREYAKFEHLVKVGFFRLASHLAYRGNFGGSLDHTQNRTHRILKVGAEDVPFLRELDVEMTGLRIFQAYCQAGLKARQQLFRWQLERRISHALTPILAHVTPHRMMRYLDAQWESLRMRRTRYGAIRYNDFWSLVREYDDYLDMCVKQNYDMTASFVLFPQDLQKRHDQVARRIRLKADAQTRRDFAAAYRRVTGQLDFEMDGLKIVYPATPDDLVNEGHTLHHCVGSYVDRVAQQKSLILFLRRCDAAARPFYTIEVIGQEVTQVHGMQHAQPTPEVEAFIRQWKTHRLQAMNTAKAA